MHRDIQRILVTGPPGAGKTTLVRRVVEELALHESVGFYTEEIRELGERKGFELVSLDGRRGLLAQVGLHGPHRVGKYGVDIEGLDRFLDTVPWPQAGSGLVVIDEIGKMECLSRTFQGLVRRLLDSNTRMLATVARRGSGFIEEVKQRPDVELLELVPRNRESLATEIIRRLA